MSDTFWGYRRKDHSVGIRNHIAIIPSVFCAAKVAERISQQVTGSIFLRHPVGCSQVGNDLELTAKTLIQIGKNPNYAGVLVIGLGCERFSPYEFYEELKMAGKMVDVLVIQEEGDSLQAIQKGVRIAKEMQQKASVLKREEIDISELIIGLKCGGTDATSGLLANPALGVASDRLIKQGGSSILSEVTELLGTEHILARRAINQEVAEDIKKMIEKTEKKLQQQISESTNERRKHLISTGNYDGGVSSVVEKALGGMKKSGKAQIQGVISYAEKPNKKGLFIMDSPGQDAEVATGMVGAGAQIILFTTGRGTPTGFPGVPVIKITGNPITYQKMKENIDVNAGEIINGTIGLEEVAEMIYQEIIQVASGKLIKAELLGHDELFAITRLP